VMAGRDQVFDNGGADESGRAGDEYTHEQVSIVSVETDVGLRCILVK
jgi:hypothetical protein